MSDIVLVRPLRVKPARDITIRLRYVKRGAETIIIQVYIYK